MRVTQAEICRTFDSNISQLNENLSDVNSQASSGKKLNDLADSPDGCADLVMISDQAQKVDAYHSNINTSNYYLNSAQSALNEANNLFSSIQTLGTQATADTLNPDARTALVNQLHTYRDQMIALGNSQVNGRYLFAGTSATSTPFELSGDAVVYNGSDKVNAVPVSDGVEVQQGVSGSAAFGSAFNVIDGLVNSLDAGDVDGAKASLTQFSDALGELEQSRGSIGANLSQLQSLSGALDTTKATLTERKSNLEDANMVDTTLQLSQLSSALDGALSAGAKIIQQPILFDILA